MRYVPMLLYFAICQATPAQSAGVFLPAGSMTTARVAHTATLLANGDVLIAGGYNASGSLNAEVYDAVAGTFTAIGAMVNAFSPTTATLLPDGRVLLVGRDSEAELYDPSSRNFTVTGNGETARGCAATLLGNGKVLFTDDPPPYGPSATAELYDPDTGGFAPTGPYASTELARLDRAVAPYWDGWDCRRATLLADGRVLVAGGVAAEIYDPQTNAFSLTGTVAKFPDGSMTTLPAWHDPSNATLLLNGMVLFSSGDRDLGPSSEAWLYNPVSGVFLKTGAMNTARNLNATTLLPDGFVLASGGRLASPAFNGASASAKLYIPAAATFSSNGDMITPRWGHTATLLTDGRVLITGGMTGVNDSSFLSSAEIYLPADSIPPPMLFPVSGDRRGQGAIWHADTGNIASGENPSTAGDVLSLYTSRLAPGGVIPPQVSIGGRLGEVLYFGDAPGYSGYYQVNVRVPSGIAPGSAIPVRLNYLGRPSNDVTIAVQ